MSSVQELSLAAKEKVDTGYRGSTGRSINYTTQERATGVPRQELFLLLSQKEVM